MPGTASDLANGIATMIDAAGLATYRPTGVYQAAETGIFHKVLPDKPDRCVVLTAIPMTDSITEPLGLVMLQVRTRGLPNQPLDVDDLADPIFTLLHGQTNLTFGSVHVIQMYRTTSISNGQDDSKRWERIDQFYLDLDYPPTPIRPEGGSW